MSAQNFTVNVCNFVEVYKSVELNAIFCISISLRGLRSNQLNELEYGVFGNSSNMNHL